MNVFKNKFFELLSCNLPAFCVFLLNLSWFVCISFSASSVFLVIANSVLSIFFYIFVYTYTCNDMRSVMLQINEYDDDDDDYSNDLFRSVATCRGVLGSEYPRITKVHKCFYSNSFPSSLTQLHFSWNLLYTVLPFHGVSFFLFSFRKLLGEVKLTSLLTS